MSSIATVVAVICIAALCCSLVSVVSPQGNTRRVLNTVLGAFILCAMIIPIKNAVSGFDFNISITAPADNLTASADEAYNNAVMIETKNRLESTLKAYLEYKDICIIDTDIQLASYDNGGIYIDNISIYISADYEDRANEISKLTQKKFEVKPHIYVR